MGRPPKAPMVCLSKRHGTHHAYKAFGCRCPEMLVAAAEYRRTQRARVKENGPAVVDGTPTHRRIRALQAAGWTSEELAEKLGNTVTAGAVRKLLENPRVYRTTQDRIEALYETLTMLPGPSEVNRVRSARKGWAPPLAWDDITDLEAQPDFGTELGYRRGVAAGRRSSREMMYEYKTIRESGIGHAYALKELGVRQDAWEAARRRQEQKTS